MVPLPTPVSLFFPFGTIRFGFVSQNARYISVSAHGMVRTAQLVSFLHGVWVGEADEVGERQWEVLEMMVTSRAYPERLG